MSFVIKDARIFTGELDPGVVVVENGKIHIAEENFPALRTKI
jgi:hypothetical protein